MQYIVAQQALSEDEIAEFSRLLYGARQRLAAELPAQAALPVHGR